MSQSEQKVLQYLDEAHASELGLARSLQSQIMMTPRGGYRSALEVHLRETRDHARRLEVRMGELGHGRDSLQALLGFAESALGQVIALGKAPIELARGNGGEEKVLKNAKDACAAEALEIATYTALERLARTVKDEATAKLAASIREDEEKMLARVLRELPKLTDAMVRAEIDGEHSYELGDTGAADAVRDVGASAKRAARKVESQARGVARNARKVPGVVAAEGQIKGAIASAGDLAIAGYDDLTASDIVEKLPGLPQIELAKIDSYERRHEDRSTVLAKLATLRGEEPWPGYDELNANEIHEILNAGDEQLAKQVASYERSHKNRAGVLADTERERASA
jgi:ferritin-like metal-binding protein YciE